MKLNSTRLGAVEKKFTWFIFSAQLRATHHVSLLPLSWRLGVPNLIIDQTLNWCMLWSSNTRFKINITGIWPAPISYFSCTFYKTYRKMGLLGPHLHLHKLITFDSPQISRKFKLQKCSHNANSKTNEKRFVCSFVFLLFYDVVLQTQWCTLDAVTVA